MQKTRTLYFFTNFYIYVYLYIQCTYIQERSMRNSSKSSQNKRKKVENEQIGSQSKLITIKRDEKALSSN